MSTLVDDPQARELILLLWNAEDREAGVAVIDVPEPLRDDALLSECHGAGLIEFLRRNHCFVGGQLRVEEGWSVAELYKAGRSPVWELLRRTISEEVPEEIRPRIRLTNYGCDVAGTLIRQATRQTDQRTPSLVNSLGVRESRSLHSALNWLQAKFLESDKGKALVKKQMFHDYLISVDLPVASTVEDCIARGWIEHADAYEPLDSGGPPVGTLDAFVLKMLAKTRPVKTVPGYRILLAVKTADVSAIAGAANPQQVASAPLDQREKGASASADKLFPMGELEDRNLAELAISSTASVVRRVVCAFAATFCDAIAWLWCYG